MIAIGTTDLYTGKRVPNQPNAFVYADHLDQLPNGNVVVRLGDGSMLTQSDDGTWHFNATQIGAWEQARINGARLTYNVGGRPYTYLYDVLPS